RLHPRDAFEQALRALRIAMRSKPAGRGLDGVEVALANTAAGQEGTTVHDPRRDSQELVALDGAGGGGYARAGRPDDLPVQPALRGVWGSGCRCEDGEVGEAFGTASSCRAQRCQKHFQGGEAGAEPPDDDHRSSPNADVPVVADMIEAIACWRFRAD